MERKIAEEPKLYKNAELLHDLNNLLIGIKIWLYDEGIIARSYHPKPTSEEIDKVMQRVRTELMKDAEPMRKY